MGGQAGGSVGGSPRSKDLVSSVGSVGQSVSRSVQLPRSSPSLGMKWKERRGKGRKGNFYGCWFGCVCVCVCFGSGMVGVDGMGWEIIISQFHICHDIS